MTIWRHSKNFEGLSFADAVTLGEGETPLIQSRRIAAALGLRRLWFKCEGANPTGSYKDRFAATAVNYLRRDGRLGCLGTSSGNTGAALAAYCAKAGLSCCLAIVEGAPEGKLRQMLAHGARLFRIRGFGNAPAVDAAVMSGLRDLAGRLDLGLEISAFKFSPRGMAGVQTVSFEIAEALGKVPVEIFSPAGGGGLTLAVARGFALAGMEGRVHCVQPSGNDTIATPLRSKGNTAVAVESKTGISGLQVGSVIDGDLVIEACRRSGGQGYSIDDEAAFRWQKRLAREEGIFCEPAGAVALAGVEQAIMLREISTDVDVVCLVTGNGFKDERSLARMVGPGMPPLLEDFGEFAERVAESPRPRIPNT